MTDQYDNSNSGVLFKNEEPKSERSPHYNGEGQTTCPDCGAVQEFWIASWINTAKRTGKKFMSLKFSRKEAQPGQVRVDPDFEEEDMPF